MYFPKALIIKFFKFALVGFSGIIIDFSITYFLKEFLKIQKYLANAIGFLTAATTNFFLNRMWTFENSDPAITLQYFKFFFVSLVGLGLNTLFIYILVTRYRKNFYLSKFFAISVVIMWNFFANLVFTFNN